MKKKGNFRKVVSGLLAGMTMLSTVLSPMTAYAAEIQPEEKPPLYEEVKDLLDEDEVVTAKDYEIETGSIQISLGILSKGRIFSRISLLARSSSADTLP